MDLIVNSTTHTYNVNVTEDGKTFTGNIDVKEGAVTNISGTTIIGENRCSISMSINTYSNLNINGTDISDVDKARQFLLEIVAYFKEKYVTE